MSGDPPSFPTPFQHIVLQSNNEYRPPTPSTMTTFSYTSTIDSRIFREDNGRRFQASNDDYALPADEEEGNRLDIQHRGWKAVNGGKNYLAPIDQVLLNGGEGKRVIDIGTGTGIWAREIAIEFPKAEVVGFDLVPYEIDPATTPVNLDLVLGDCTKGISYPDGYFDVIHARLITGGIRDWKSLVDEAVRICKPGGLLVFAEPNCRWHLVDPAPQGTGTGFNNFMALVNEACATRGLAVDAGEITLPELMKNHVGIRDYQQAFIYLPLHAWSSDPRANKAGTIMIEDAKLLPETFRLLVIDACAIPTDQYDRLKQAFLDDLQDQRVHSAMPMWHNWGWRV